MEAVIAHRCITFDPMCSIFISMPPAWRASGGGARRDDFAFSGTHDVPDANSGFRASMPFLAQTALVLGRAALRFRLA